MPIELFLAPLALFVVVGLLAAVLILFFQKPVFSELPVAAQPQGIQSIENVAPSQLNPPHAITLGPPQPLRRNVVRVPGQGQWVRKGAPLVVKPILHPLWQIKGWRQVEGRNEHAGSYTAAGVRYRGLITQPYPGKYEAYIWRPPLRALESNTYHRACFSNGSSTDAGQYKVHFSVEPACLDHAIVNIEMVLEEALRGG